MDPSSESSKRCDIVVSTASLTSYLLSALKVDFENLKIHLKRDKAH